MLIRIAVPLMAAAVMIFACGPHPRAGENTSRTTARKNIGVVSTVHVDANASEVHFTLAVQNSRSPTVAPTTS